MTNAERCLRKLYLQENFRLTTDLAYQFDERLFATEAGVGVALWINDEDDGEKIARRAVFTTLEENGIPSNILHFDPIVHHLGVGTYTNQNPRCKKFAVGRSVIGRLHYFLFPFREIEDRAWFLTEDGVVSTRLALV